MSYLKKTTGGSNCPPPPAGIWFSVVGTSIGMCLEAAPNKIIHWIKVGAAGRPLLLGDEVVAVLLNLGHGPVGHMAGGRVLLPDPGATSTFAHDPG